jgi:alkanesulfonate monooxygenase SsuD/methylene tetrahydromethanopterin reductase-like flavin-dependent oxidoreductase (luciferase family)
MPILIGGGGEKVTLRLVAEHAQMWNTIATPNQFARKLKILEGYCRELGRDPAEIERTANVTVANPEDVEEWVDAGLQHFVLRLAKPFDTRALEMVLKASRA